MDEREREEMEADERRRNEERKRELEERARAEQHKQYEIIAIHLVREMLPAILRNQQLAVIEISKANPDRDPDALLKGLPSAETHLKFAHELAIAFIAKAATLGVGLAAKNLIMLGDDNPQQSVPMPPHLQRQLQDALSGRGGPAGKLFGG